jgi:hypothetical protein
LGLIRIYSKSLRIHLIALALALALANVSP